MWSTILKEAVIYKMYLLTGFPRLMENMGNQLVVCFERLVLIFLSYMYVEKKAQGLYID